MALSEAKKIAAQGKNVIVDIAIFEEKELADLNAENVLRILAYAPPITLIERDRKRTRDKECSLEAQAAKRSFIIESFYNLYQLAEDKESALDSFNPRECELGIEGLKESFYLNECIDRFYKKFSGDERLFIKPCFKHDFVINTAKFDLDQYLSVILAELNRAVTDSSTLSSRALAKDLPIRGESLLVMHSSYRGILR